VKDGVCPKCGSHDVRSTANLEFNPERMNRILIDYGFFLTGQTVELVFYICADCGYVESYIADEKELQKVVEKLPRVSELKKKRGEI
jgi:predicted nucleic-acid-binding Zn-ribbon protein